MHSRSTAQHFGEVPTRRPAIALWLVMTAAIFIGAVTGVGFAFVSALAGWL